jgi:hypothetical protein
MPQGILPFKYEEEKRTGGMTALGGLASYVELSYVMGLSEAVGRHVNLRNEGQGFTDAEVVMSLILVNLAGGECVDDLRLLEGDEGFCRILQRVKTQGMPRNERRALERRWRKERKRTFPSASAVFRYLELFHDSGQEEFRIRGKAFIPEPNEHLRGLMRLNGDFAARVQKRSPQECATLDMDATLVESSKKEALYCYKGFKGYQPLQTYWFEQDLVLHSEFRDGNVPAGYEQLRVFKEALDLLPSGVERVFLRSDTAAYQHDLMKYCAEAKSARFGVIGFAIGVDVTPEFKKAVWEVAEFDWRRLYREVKGKLVETGQEYAEVCFVPKELSRKKHGPEYRYLAIREPLSQPDLPGLELQRELPFPTMDLGPTRYKVTGIVTNRDIPADDLIWWYRRRCGKSEEVHAVMKEDLAGGRLPSGKFGVNAAWWQIMILAFNLNSAMKHLVLGGDWVNKRLKAIRFWLINLPGRVVEHARGLVIRLVGGHPSNETLLCARIRMVSLYDTS